MKSNVVTVTNLLLAGNLLFKPALPFQTHQPNTVPFILQIQAGFVELIAIDIGVLLQLGAQLKNGVDNTGMGFNIRL